MNEKSQEEEQQPIGEHDLLNDDIYLGGGLLDEVRKGKKSTRKKRSSKNNLSSSSTSSPSSCSRVRSPSKRKHVARDFNPYVSSAHHALVSPPPSPVKVPKPVLKKTTVTPAAAVKKVVKKKSEKKVTIVEPVKEEKQTPAPPPPPNPPKKTEAAPPLSPPQPTIPKPQNRVVFPVQVAKQQGVVIRPIAKPTYRRLVVVPGTMRTVGPSTSSAGAGAPRAIPSTSSSPRQLMLPVRIVPRVAGHPSPTKPAAAQIQSPATGPRPSFGIYERPRLSYRARSDSDPTRPSGPPPSAP